MKIANMKIVVIGCDNAATNLKNEIIRYLEALGVKVENIGCDSTDDPSMYPCIAEKVCKTIIESNYEYVWEKESLALNLPKKIVKEWASLKFVDGRSTPKVNAITEIEEKNMKN